MSTRARVVVGLLLLSLIVPMVAVRDVDASNPVRRIGVLAERPGPEWEIFRTALRDLGYAEGRNIAIEWRWAEGRNERFGALASELVRAGMDIIVTQGTPAARAARAATTKIPIVMAIAADPVKAGLVQSLARPGGNITGSTSLAHDLHPKQLQLLKEMLPNLGRVAVLYDPTNPMHAPALKEIADAAVSLHIETHLVDAGGPAELGRALASLHNERFGALLVVPSPIFDSVDTVREIVRATDKARLPAIYNKRHFAEHGGLVVYGARFSDFFRRAAVYVDRIFKGSRPGDLPIELATHFELVVNVGTAQNIGIVLPPAVLQRADHVVQPGYVPAGATQ